MTCIALDDEPIALAIIERYAQQLPDLQLVGTFTDAAAAAAFLHNNTVDLLLTDINMPDVNGLQFVSELPDEHPMVSFVTAYKEHAHTGFDLNVGLTGQIASTNLLGTEQLVMGGATAVRGFGSSDLYADRGAVVRTEVATPPVGLLNLFGSKANPDSESNSDEVSVPGKTQSLQDQIRLIAFYDLGVGGSVDPLPGEEDYRTLQSCGVGLRYHVQQNLSINFDYGWQLSEVGAFGEDSRGHVSMQLSF